MVKLSKKLKELFSNKSFQIDLAIFLGLVLLSIAVNIPAYLHVNSDRAMLNILSIDEWIYTNFLRDYFYASLQGLDFIKLAILSDPFGYGTLFWYVSGIIGAPFYFFGTVTSEIIVLRISSAAWLGISIFFIYKIIYLLGKQRVYAVLGALSVLTIPGYYFYTKAFSAEFMTMAFGVIAIYYLLKDNYKGKKYLYWALIFIGIATGLKISMLLFGPAIAAYAFFVYRDKPLKTFAKVCVVSVFMFIIGFIFTNPYLVLHGKAGWNGYITEIKQNMTSNQENHGQSIEGIDARAWFDTVIIDQYFFQSLFILLIVALVWQLYREHQHKKYNTLMLLGTAGIYTLYIIFGVKKLWSWYLFPSMLFLVVPLFLIRFADIPGLNKIKSFQIWFYIIFIVCSALLNLAAIQANYNSIAIRETQEAFQIKQTAKTQFDDWLTENNISDISILKSPYIYFDAEQYTNITVNPIWAQIKDTTITAYHPDLLLFEKDYAFFKADEEIKTWTSYEAILEERELATALTSSGITVKDELYKYQQVLETDSFFVYERVYE